MGRNARTRHKHNQIFIKRGLFWIQCQRRDFLKQSSLGILPSPALFPSITTIKPQKTPFKGCFLSSPPWLGWEFWPGNTKEKGWEGLGGFFVLLRGFLFDLSCFPLSRQLLLVPYKPHPNLKCF